MNAADVDFKVYKPPTHPHRMSRRQQSRTCCDARTQASKIFPTLTSPPPLLTSRQRRLPFLRELEPWPTLPYSCALPEGASRKPRETDGQMWVCKSTLAWLPSSHLSSRQLYASNSQIGQCWRRHFPPRTRFEQSMPLYVQRCERTPSLSSSFYVGTISDIFMCSGLIPCPASPDQSPPKRDLKVSDPKVRDLSLTELQLAPSSVLLLRFEDDALNGQYNTTLVTVPGCLIVIQVQTFPPRSQSQFSTVLSIFQFRAKLHPLPPPPLPLRRRSSQGPQQSPCRSGSR
jgi:hypothetical protein